MDITAFGSTQPCVQVRTLINMPRCWPVFIDQYDSYLAITYFAGINPEEDQRFTYMAPEVKDEQYCYKNVDGIIARSGDLCLLIKKKNINKPVFIYEDGCNHIY